jgi:hypothetical protein
MKKIGMFLMAATLLAFSTQTFAESSVKTAPTAKTVPFKVKARKTERTKLQRHVGEIRKISLNDQLLVVKNPRGEESFKIFPETQVKRGRERHLQSDLEEGMKVTIKYSEENGTKIARVVTLPKK